MQCYLLQRGKKTFSKQTNEETNIKRDSYLFIFFIYLYLFIYFYRSSLTDEYFLINRTIISIFFALLFDWRMEMIDWIEQKFSFLLRFPFTAKFISAKPEMFAIRWNEVRNQSSTIYTIFAFRVCKNNK